MLFPLSDENWPDSLTHLRGRFTGQANVYRTMAHHPALLAAWQGLRTHVVTGNALAPEALEVVILRTGHRLAASYERAHHVVRARNAGLPDTRIAAVEGPPDAMDPRDAPLARAVDALIDVAAIPADLQGELARTHGKEGLLDLIATVGFYSTLAFIVKSFGTPLDPEIRAALDARPFPGP